MLEISMILAIGGAVSMVIGTLMWNIRRSRCTKCNSPCLSIERENMTDDEMKNDPLPMKFPTAL